MCKKILVYNDILMWDILLIYHTIQFTLKYRVKRDQQYQQTLTIFIDIVFLISLCFRFAAFLRIDIRGLTGYYYYQYIDKAMDIVNSLFIMQPQCR